MLAALHNIVSENFDWVCDEEPCPAWWDYIRQALLATCCRDIRGSLDGEGADVCAVSLLYIR
eukprot:12915291-Prorocentrum_lima.AAC.1